MTKNINFHDGVLEIFPIKCNIIVFVLLGSMSTFMHFNMKYPPALGVLSLT